MRVISLGWGIQSFTLTAMSELGELGEVDCAIHADTTFERNETYELIKKNILSGTEIITVRAENPRIVTDRVGGEIFIPAFTASSQKGGQLRRQCTRRWKIAPIRKWFQANRNGEKVEMLIGISLDEFQRMRDSNVKYITNRYPLVEKRMTRNDCKKWLLDHGLEIPVKSSCVFCPYHDSKTWREIKLANNGDWEKAIEVDERIRKVRPPYDLFLHPSRKPLKDVDLRNEEDRGQMLLWDEECSGMCWL